MIYKINIKSISKLNYEFAFKIKIDYIYKYNNKSRRADLLPN